MTVRFRACQEYSLASFTDRGERDVSAALTRRNTLPDDEEHVIIPVDALRVPDGASSTSVSLEMV